MNKLYIAAALVFGMAQASFAQGKGKVEFGLNIGVNTSSISDSENQSDSGTGMNIGASADYYFSDSWSIKGKLIYDEKGWDNDYIDVEDGSGFITTYKTNVNVNYLTVPIMANWHFAPKRNWYLSFGPYAGFLLNAKETRFDTDLKEAFNTNDFGLAFGIGVKIPVSNKLKISLEYEGQGGFSDIFKDNSGDAIQNSRNSFNAGINFMMN
ncbi:MAG TPA: porin family protein [Flavobacterium sp.]|nr:porin family protein [Flavobacterium sp.]